MGFWTRPLAFMERCRRRFGKRFTVQLPLAPPFVYLSEPDQLKQMFTAPPEVLHPGRGARVLEPLVGSNSVILLDESAHMEQRKLRNTVNGHVKRYKARVLAGDQYQP